MSRQRYIFKKFLLLFLIIAPSANAGRKAMGSNFKFPIKKSASYTTKTDDLKKLSNDEISLALSDLSVNDLRVLNNLLTKKLPTDCSYTNEIQNDRNSNLKRLVRESQKPNVNLFASTKMKKSPEQNIRDEIQQLRDNVEKQISSKLVRTKREDNGIGEYKFKDSIYYINSPNIEEYIKLLEGSFPNSAASANNEGSHVRVKRQ